MGYGSLLTATLSLIREAVVDSRLGIFIIQAWFRSLLSVTIVCRKPIPLGIKSSDAFCMNVAKLFFANCL